MDTSKKTTVEESQGNNGHGQENNNENRKEIMESAREQR